MAVMKAKVQNCLPKQIDKQIKFWSKILSNWI